MMKFWESLWTFCLLGAGAAFAFITLVVIVKGVPDLREMLRQLRRQNVDNQTKATNTRKQNGGS
jgi:hypothetical protein